MTKPKKPELYLTSGMTVNSDTNTCTLVVAPRYWSESGYWMSPGYLGHEDLSGLVLHAQGNVKDDLLVGDLYAWEVQCRHYGGIELHDAERMVKVLRRVNKGTQTLMDARGYALDFPEFVTRAAEVLKIKGGVPSDYHVCDMHSTVSLGQWIDNLRWAIKCASDLRFGMRQVADYLNRGVPLRVREDSRA